MARLIHWITDLQILLCLVIIKIDAKKSVSDKSVFSKSVPAQEMKRENTLKAE